MPKTRPPYPEQFRREAVELVGQGRSIRDVADILKRATALFARETETR
jgi:transposase-like protein